MGIQNLQENILEFILKRQILDFLARKLNSIKSAIFAF
jgi:hypothetical protein